METNLKKTGYESPPGLIPATSKKYIEQNYIPKYKKSKVYDFDIMLQRSKRERAKQDLAALLDLIPGAVSARETEDIERDKKGIDYIVTLRSGADIYIDAKQTLKPERHTWRYGEPELLIEVYSALETQKAGWTLDESKVTDYILYSFCPEDTQRRFLVPFQLLRMAARKYIHKWLEYKRREVKTKSRGRGWTTVVTYVPVSKLMQAVMSECYIGEDKIAKYC